MEASGARGLVGEQAAKVTAAARRRLVPAVLAALAALLCFAASALGAGRVYWVNNTANKISYANLDGSGGGDLNTDGATVDTPLGLAIDTAAGRIYWSNVGLGTISYANLDGSGGGEFGAGPIFSIGLTIDPVARRLYWSNFLEEKISYASLDGLGGGDLDTGEATVAGPFGLVVDPTAGRVYWGNFSDGTMSFANLDGSGGGDLFLGSAALKPKVGLVTGLAIDPAGERIYWSNLSEGEVLYARLDGTGGGELFGGANALGELVGLAIDPATRRMYMGSEHGVGPEEGLGYLSLDGGEAGQIATAGTTPGSRLNPILLEPPVVDAPPTISGGAAAGATLTCAGAAWAADIPEAGLFRAPDDVSRSWSRDGAPIAGATGASIQATDPGRYACTVRASNAAGSTQASAAQLVSAPPTSPPPVSIAAAGGRAVVRKGRALVRLRCPGPGDCNGRLQLFRHGRLGAASFALAGGGAAVAPVKLDRRARRMLRKAGRRGLRVRLRGTGVSPRAVKLKAAGKRRPPRRSPRRL